MTEKDRSPLSVGSAEYRRQLRQKMIQRRLKLSFADYTARSAALCTQLETHFAAWQQLIVGFYWPIKNEPDVRPWIERLLTRGGRAVLPVVLDRKAPLKFREWRPGQTLAEDDYGIPFPATGTFLQPQALLLPLNAFDAQGFRLGYGAGFFDRTLASLTPSPLTIGCGFDFQRVESIVPQGHDIPMRGIVTESHYIDLS